MNPKDPLLKTDKTERALFDLMSKVANGFPTEHVIGAAANMVLNAIRQSNATQRPALDQLDQISAKLRAALGEHYDVLGRRRNIFPFHQVIEMPLVDARSKVNGS